MSFASFALSVLAVIRCFPSPDNSDLLSAYRTVCMCIYIYIYKLYIYIYISLSLSLSRSPSISLSLSLKSLVVFS